MGKKRKKVFKIQISIIIYKSMQSLKTWYEVPTKTWIQELVLNA